MGGGKTFHKGDGRDGASVPGHKVSPHDVAQVVVAAFHQHVGYHGLDELFRGVFPKDDDVIDAGECREHECPFFLRSKEHPFMLANIDGYVKNEDGTYSLLEIKTAASYSNNDWQGNSKSKY